MPASCNHWLKGSVPTNSCVVCSFSELNLLELLMAYAEIIWAIVYFFIQRKLFRNKIIQSCICIAEL